jgi:hypothetical protein
MTPEAVYIHTHTFCFPDHFHHHTFVHRCPASEPAHSKTVDHTHTRWVQGQPHVSTHVHTFNHIPMKGLLHA